MKYKRGGYYVRALSNEMILYNLIGCIQQSSRLFHLKKKNTIIYLASKLFKVIYAFISFSEKHV